MKPFLTFAFTLLALQLHAAIGPDLTKGTDVAYFTKLRHDTLQKEGYVPIWRIDEEREKIFKTAQEGDLDAALKLADAWLNKVPIDADIHKFAALCYKVKGDVPSMLRHQSAFYGLLQSITAEGDGLSDKTPYKVVSVDEEYSVVREIGGEVKSQKLSGNLDVLEVEHRGKTLTMYFDVSVHLNALKKAIEGK